MQVARVPLELKSHIVVAPVVLRHNYRYPVAGRDPATHVLFARLKTWMRGPSPRKGNSLETKSPQRRPQAGSQTEPDSRGTSPAMTNAGGLDRNANPLRLANDFEPDSLGRR